MSKREKLLERILRGTSDNDISFTELCSLLIALGFEERIKGSHHIFSYPGIAEIINIQPRGSNAKGYQVKQIRNLIIDNKLVEEK
ncbi:MAG TPA: type II toxin-antitoxin system HicA family toxin [Candidatus Kapabacteria bacterium]|nr:type II toxin-antitoxin system HicA family toxin [Candidatus Kapabacteria bacterium]